MVLKHIQKYRKGFSLQYVFKNKITITVSHKNYNSYLLYYYNKFGRKRYISRYELKKNRLLLLVVVGIVLDILHQNKLLKNLLMTST